MHNGDKLDKLTSKEFLLSRLDFGSRTLGSLSELTVRGFHQDIPDDDRKQFNQKEMIILEKHNMWLVPFGSDCKSHT